ncbi:energy-coupling factor transporter transmembrane protein EcfT [Tumebacillus sp. ITR2]|uniref:Energy-coupling factor transporter transmembrane protein EcfT n=1 Tax=Tumebacillus amylolyticus TaxID=2801339 RepID=A0ABS1J917_9BACL|nr:energy-coupling factor transporter transmembrane protein EcfT [Tumebacillus amylolyticus]
MSSHDHTAGQVLPAAASSLVARVNPSVKLLLHLLCMLVFIFVHEPKVAFVLMLIPMVITLTAARIPLWTFLKRMAPFLILFVSTTWVLAAYGQGETVWWHGGWITITEEGLVKGLNIGLRMLGFVSYGALFAMTTDVTLLSLSLMQQLKLPPKIGYALLAGFRFLPMFREEYEQIKAAHRVRGVARVPGLRGKFQAFARYTIPLLAQGIRKAERVAVALEARGFDGTHNRTFYRELKVGMTDFAYFILLLALHVLVFYYLMR